MLEVSMFVRYLIFWVDIFYCQYKSPITIGHQFHSVPQHYLRSNWCCQLYNHTWKLFLEDINNFCIIKMYQVVEMVPLYNVVHIIIYIMYFLDWNIIIDLLTEQTVYQHCIYWRWWQCIISVCQFLEVLGHNGLINGQFLIWVAIYMHFTLFVEISVSLLGFFFNNQFAIWIMS